MMHGFAELDLDDLIDEDPPPSTVRTPGSAAFHVEDKMTALFVSATWQLVATVKDIKGVVTVIAQSTEQPKAHSAAFLQRWARAAIRNNKRQLRKLGVDVEATYLRYGGDLEDLEETG